MTTKRYIHLIAVVAILGLLSSLGVATQTYAQFNVQGGRIDAFTFYIPFETDELDNQFDIGQPSPGSLIDADIETIISIAVNENDSKIYYDQWEDLLEPDLTQPTQFSTQVWGDNFPANGIPPGFSTDILNAGDVITLRNVVVLPRVPTQLFFDGGDALTSVDGAIAVSLTFWTAPRPPNPGSLFADAWELYPTNRWGTEYRIPIGEDLAGAGPGQRGGFTIVGLTVQAVEDNTTVNIDLDGNGPGGVTPTTLDQGEHFNVIQGVRTGALVQASAPVQVHLFAADPTSTWEARGYTMVPFDQWTDDYLAPRSSDGDFWLYNPNLDVSGLTVTAETFGGASTTFTIPANSTIKFPAAGLSLATGTRFRSSGGNFYGVAALDDDQTQDWGYALLPTVNLTTQVLIGLGIGNSNSPPGPLPVGDGFESRIYVTAVNATTIFVDYDNDGTRVVPFPVASLEEVAITDPLDFDMTGAFLYTDGEPFAAAWGQDESADPSDPSIDAGTSITPLRSLNLQKTFNLLDDVDCSGSITLGDTVRFELEYFNTSTNPVTNVIVEDNFPSDLAYVVGSTLVSGAPVPDGTSGTPFLLDEGGYNVGTVNEQESGVLTFDATVNNAAGAITNQANASTQDLPLGGDAVTVFMPTGTGGPILEVNKTLIDPATGTVTSGQTITFSLTITNASNSTITTLPLQETFNEDHLTFLNASVPPDISASGVITWNDLTTPFGDLSPGAIINTTVSFVVDQLPPTVNNTTLAASIVSAQRSDSPARLTCSGNAAVNFAAPPTPTPTPPPPVPTSSPGGGGNTTPRPPTLTPAPVAAIVPAATAPPVLPVAFLPETGLREFGWGDLAIMAGVLLVVLGGISAARRFSNKD